MFRFLTKFNNFSVNNIRKFSLINNSPYKYVLSSSVVNRINAKEQIRTFKYVPIESDNKIVVGHKMTQEIEKNVLNI